MSEPKGIPDAREQFRMFVTNELQRYSGFRDHKETMAYAGIALFTGAAATLLTSKDWPPQFAENNPWLIVSAFTLLWLFVIVYLRYQLRRRRWAALRVAGCERLLCKWLLDPPQAGPSPPTSYGKPKASLRLRLVDYIWPLKCSVRVFDTEVRVYPAELQRSWLDAEPRGSDALFHERIIHSAGWVAYLAVIARTLW